MSQTPSETIYALATPPGVGGIGVIRVSGSDVSEVAVALMGHCPDDRKAELVHFRDSDGRTIDSGIALWFKAPGSFTGEDVLEIQAHGGPVILQMLCRRVSELGARAARPGEFSERAFLNGKLDLAQAEAIADLISAGTEASARAAQRSLEGALSDQVASLQEQMIRLRVFVEAALDFPDEEIDFIAESDVQLQLTGLCERLDQLLDRAQEGKLLRDGINVAIIGQPNAGKSSLLNLFTGQDSAIVTDTPGTTRDVLTETVSLGGLPVHIADTAGLREAADLIEAEGIRRARRVFNSADLVLLVIDLTRPLDEQLALRGELPDNTSCILVMNKVDLIDPSGIPALRPENELQQGDKFTTVFLSALDGQGLELLIESIQRVSGLTGQTEGSFSARTRHIEALRRTQSHLAQGMEQLDRYQSAETLAEELRLAQGELSQITGEYLADDLLGEIFSSFCIGK